MSETPQVKERRTGDRRASEPSVLHHATSHAKTFTVLYGAVALLAAAFGWMFVQFNNLAEIPQIRESLYGDPVKKIPGVEIRLANVEYAAADTAKAVAAQEAVISGKAGEPGLLRSVSALQQQMAVVEPRVNANTSMLNYVVDSQIRNMYRSLVRLECDRFGDSFSGDCSGIDREQPDGR